MKSLGIRIGFFALVLLVWMGVAQAHIWDATLFPSPISVGARLIQLFKDGSLLDATALSLKRVLIGYLISLVIGVPMGILLARSKLAAETLGALVVGAQALPSICWLPLALLWFGLSDTAILFVVIMGSMVSITVAVQDGVKNLPPGYVQAARTMGAKGLSLTTRVLLPASLPAVLIGAKLGWAYAWRALMAGELLFVSLGLGHLLMMGRELSDMSQVMAVMIVIIAIGLATDTYVFGFAERRIRERFGLDRA